MDFKKQKLLVIAPHPDDEVIGCGGLIAKIKDAGGQVYVLFLTVGDTRDMELLGAKVISVTTGSQTLKDAINEALRDWMAHPYDTFYCLGSCVGPHPYPVMVRDFQSVIGKEAKGQHFDAEKKEPDYLLACVGGGSNS